jgi:hypothetical protein
MEKSYKVGSDTVEAYGAKNLPASFVILSECLDGVKEVRFLIQEIGDQRLYVSDDFLSPYNATLIRTKLLPINSNSIIEKYNDKREFCGFSSKVVLSDNDIVEFTGEYYVLPQPDEYCAAVVAFLSRKVK